MCIGVAARTVHSYVLMRYRTKKQSGVIKEEYPINKTLIENITRYIKHKKSGIPLCSHLIYKNQVPVFDSSCMGIKEIVLSLYKI